MEREGLPLRNRKGLLARVGVLLATALIPGASPILLSETAHAVNKYDAQSGDTADCTLDKSFEGNGPDPWPHTYYYSDLTPSVRDAGDAVRTNVIDRTVVDTVLLTSVSERTDVVVYDEDYSVFCGAVWHPYTSPTDPTIIGMVVCVRLTSVGSCEKHEQRHDLSWWNESDRTAKERRSLFCHESAHTLGLDHSNMDSCLFWQTQGPNSPDRFHEHDLWMLNGGPWRLTSQEDPKWYMPSRLSVREEMRSPNGDWRLKVQSDGNLVLYDRTNTAVWATNKFTSQYTWIVMQTDGNFVQYATDTLRTWVMCSTRTNGHDRADIRLQDDGNLVIYDPFNRPIWARYSGGTCS